MPEEITMQWVIGAYEGDQAKHVMAHAEHGIGYFMLEQGGNRTSPACMVAFQTPAGNKLSDNTTLVTSISRIEELDKRYAIRHGIRENVRPSKPLPDDFKAIMGIKD